MDPDIRLALMLAGAFLAGALALVPIMQRRVALARDRGRELAQPEIDRLAAEVAARTESAHRLEQKLAFLDDSLKRLGGEKGGLEKRLAVAEHVAATLPAVETELAAAGERERHLQRELRQALAGLGVERERASRLESVRRRLEQFEKLADRQKERLSDQATLLGEIRTRLEEERRRNAEKLALLEEAKAEMSDRFRVLAQEVLEEKGKIFGETSRSGLKGLLDPFREQLAEFRRQVDTVYVHEARERASLKREIEVLRDLNRQISQEATNLTRALKGDKKAQGTWGEMVLERVLEKSGLRKGIEYETQGGFRDAEGRLLRPDVVLRLPEDRDLVIDAKVSLSAWERHVSAGKDPARDAALAEHVQAVRAHIDSLSAKDYAAVRGIRSPEFVLMFMPVEAAFIAAFQADGDIFSHAFEKRIVVVTPTTLLVTLRTVESIWRYERQNRNAQAIFDRAAAIYDKLRLFIESMDKLGSQIDTVRDTYDQAMNRLVRGKGNLISQASRFSDLGVAVKKELPRGVIEIAEIEGRGNGVGGAPGASVPTPPARDEPGA